MKKSTENFSFHLLHIHPPNKLPSLENAVCSHFVLVKKSDQTFSHQVVDADNYY